jgi:Uma2 family endonuclease
MGAPLSIPRRPISVSEYHKMVDAGVFHEDDRMELIEGELIQMSPIGGAHIQLSNLLNRVLDRQLGDAGIVSVQNPIALPPDSEPEPDIAILQPECLRRKDVPRAEDVLLLIEISTTTLDYDRDVKIPLYAKHGIPEVWIVDEKSRSVSIYREPARTTYRRLLTAQKNDTISPLLLPSVQVALLELWL